MPWSTRAITSVSILGAAPHNNDANANHAVPIEFGVGGLFGVLLLGRPVVRGEER